MRDAVPAAIAAYFQGEKTAGVMVLPVALACAALGTWLYSRGGEWRPSAWPLWVGALVAAGIGLVLVARSDAQARDLVERLDAAVVAAELARMKRVVRTFAWLELLWCALIAGSVAAAHFVERPFVRPVAVGLVAVVAVVLIFDLVAEHRARAYLAALAGS